MQHGRKDLEPRKHALKALLDHLDDLRPGKDKMKSSREEIASMQEESTSLKEKRHT
jgi:hypothetical protein